MKNKKNFSRTQIKTNKKRLLTLALGITSAALIAGSTTALLVQLDKKPGPGPVVTNTVTFDKGTGTKIEGKTRVEFKDSTTLNNIEVPYVEKEYKSPTGETNYYPFVEWRIKGTKEAVTYNQSITQSTNLSAAYADELEEEGIEYHTVTFSPTDSSVWLTGITRVAVETGHTLAMINKPQVHVTETSNKNEFLGWALRSNPTEPLPMDMRITTNLDLVPVFVEAVKVTFSSAEHGSITGQSEIKVKSETEFGTMNTPVAVPENGYVFEGWYKDDTNETKWKADDKIYSDSNAVAHYITQGSAGYCTVNFVKNPNQTSPVITFQGNTTGIATKTDSTWADCTRPNPIAEGWRVKEWYYKTSEPTVTTGWTKLEDTTPFTSFTTVYITPLMEQNVDAIKVLGDSTIKPGATKGYTAWAIPTKAETEMEFALYSDKECKTPLSPLIARVDAVEGHVDQCEVTTFTGPDVENKSFWLKATSKIDTSKTDKMQITILPVTSLSADYMVFEDLGEGEKWYSLENVAKATQPIIATELNKEQEPHTVTIARAEFDKKVYVGDRVTKLPDGFLNSCPIFNSEIVWTSKTINIGTSFLKNNATYNKKLDLTSIQNIDHHFLADCTSYNQPVSINALTIGSSFMQGCTNFNSALSLGSVITTIGSLNQSTSAFTSHFLQDCAKFNQNISFPVSLKKIGDITMRNCGAFTSTINVACDPAIFPSNNQSFSSENSEDAIHTKGFIVDGDPVKTKPFAKKFGLVEDEGTSLIASAYRKSQVFQGLTNGKTWQEVVEACNWYEGLGANPTPANALELIKRLGGSVKTWPTATAQNYLDNAFVHTNTMGTVILNDKIHKVRFIGTMHDTITGGTTKAAFTLQLWNVLTDSNGNPLVTPYDSETNNTNINYLNSTFRKNLNGEGAGTGALSWNKSALDMLVQDSSDLALGIKKVKKGTWQYNGTPGSWSWKQLDDKIYAPTCKEICYGSDTWGQWPGDTTSTYCYWANHTERAHRLLYAVGGTVPFAYTLNNPFIKWYDKVGYRTDYRFCVGGGASQDAGGVWVFPSSVCGVSFTFSI